jgi:hypothetical protein
MFKPGPLFLTSAMCVILSACGNGESSPITPSPGGPAGYDGQWSGTTSQGRPITFTVSSDQKVTAIAIGYNFGSCSRVRTFSDLNLDIGYPPNPITATAGPSFGYGSGQPEVSAYTQILGTFSSSTRATGSMIFGDYPGCGNGIGFWTAAKR